MFLLAVNLHSFQPVSDDPTGYQSRDLLWQAASAAAQGPYALHPVSAPETWPARHIALSASFTRLHCCQKASMLNSADFQDAT